MNVKKLALLLPLFLVFASCNFCKEGNGIPAKKQIALENSPSYYSIELSARINITQTDTNLIEIVADSNFLSQIIVKQSRSKVEIYSKNCLKFKDNITINIKSKTFEKLSIEGSTVLISQNHISVESLELEAEDASTFDLFIEAEELSIDCEGASQIMLNGRTEKLEVELSGSAKLIGDKLTAKKAYVDIEGSSDASVRCSKLLDAELSGSSTLSYFGNPSKVNTDVSGSARILSK
jgi:hypothetical protein